MHPLASDLERTDRPHPRLMTYYLLSSLAALPLFPILVLLRYFRFHSMRYRFDAEGVSMRWGILFRREIVLNYARIQDIQIRANLLERWLGLARIELQTAAGSANAEMTLEGFLHYEAIRDFLYQRMRGARESAGRSGVSGQALPADESAQLAAVLRDVAAELRALRQTLERRRASDV